MIPTRGLPEDTAEIHPWIAGFIGRDRAAAASAIQERLTANSSPENAEFAARLAEFIPCRIDHWNGLSYILCVRESALVRNSWHSGDQLYIAQPLPEDVVRERSLFFDEPIQPLMREFLSKYSGCGEEMEGHAGQFVLMHDAIASDVAYYDPAKLGDWRHSRLIYTAMNGDMVFVNRRGATAWFVMETGDVVNLFNRFPEFMRHYAEFRGTREVFDSWASREFRATNPS